MSICCHDMDRNALIGLGVGASLSELTRSMPVPWAVLPVKQAVLLFFSFTAHCTVLSCQQRRREQCPAKLRPFQYI